MSRYPRKYYKLVYNMISFMLAFFAFALVFSLIYYMSPHSRNLRQYQREIYDWNKYHMAETFKGYDFSLRLGNSSSYFLRHESASSVNADEVQGLQKVLKYQESYFKWTPSMNPDSTRYFGMIDFNTLRAFANNTTSSPSLCLQLSGSTSRSTSRLTPLDDLPSTSPECLGLPVQLWRRVIVESILSTNLTCEKIYKGVYEREGECV